MDFECAMSPATVQPKAELYTPDPYMVTLLGGRSEEDGHRGRHLNSSSGCPPIHPEDILHFIEVPADQV
jgi:hypothetical protein